MAFVTINRFTAEALEKGLSSAIKAADLRWTDCGEDFKKTTKADNSCVGAVAYVSPDDSKIPGGSGTVTKLFYNCVGATQIVKLEVISAVEAVADASVWVETITAASKATLAAKCPA